MSQLDCFFNTAISPQYNNSFGRKLSSFGNGLSNGLFTPVRTLFKGRTYRMFVGQVVDEAKEKRNWFKVALSIAFLVPALILGTLVKGLTFAFSGSLRRSFSFVSDYSAYAAKRAKNKDNALAGVPVLKIKMNELVDTIARDWEKLKKSGKKPKELISWARTNLYSLKADIRHHKLKDQAFLDKYLNILDIPSVNGVAKDTDLPKVDELITFLKQANLDSEIPYSFTTLKRQLQELSEGYKWMGKELFNAPSKWDEEPFKQKIDDLMTKTHAFSKALVFTAYEEAKHDPKLTAKLLADQSHQGISYAHLYFSGVVLLYHYARGRVFTVENKESLYDERRLSHSKLSKEQQQRFFSEKENGSVESRWRNKYHDICNLLNDLGLRRHLKREEERILKWSNLDLHSYGEGSFFRFPGTTPT